MASYGVDGAMTLIPGMWVNHASRLLECCAPAYAPDPPCVRMTRGTFTCPAVTKYIWQAWLMIWSMAMGMKSTYMISTMGRMPCMAAPMPAPTIAASEIAESRTRSGPKCSSIP